MGTPGRRGCQFEAQEQGPSGAEKRESAAQAAVPPVAVPPPWTRRPSSYGTVIVISLAPPPLLLRQGEKVGVASPWTEADLPPRASHRRHSSGDTLCAPYRPLLPVAARTA